MWPHVYVICVCLVFLSVGERSTLKTALRVSGVTITHLQEQKTTVTTPSGNRYTVIERVKFTDKEYR